MIRRKFMALVAGILGLSSTAAAQDFHQHTWFSDIHRQHDKEAEGDAYVLEVNPHDGYTYYFEICLICGLWRAMGRARDTTA